MIFASRRGMNNKEIPVEIIDCDMINKEMSYESLNMKNKIRKYLVKARL